MDFSESRSAIVLELAEEFLERYRNGERPSMREYTDRHPELAAEIREVFPAMAMMENCPLSVLRVVRHRFANSLGRYACACTGEAGDVGGIGV